MGAEPCLRTLVGDSAQPEPGALLRRLRSRRRSGREVSEGCRKSVSPSGLRGDVERTPIPRTLVRRISQDLRSLREIWGAYLPLRTPFLWAEELEGHCPGMAWEGRKRKDRGDQIGRGIWEVFIKGSYNLGSLNFSLSQETGYAWSGKFLLSHCATQK